MRHDSATVFRELHSAHVGIHVVAVARAGLGDLLVQAVYISDIHQGCAAPGIKHLDGANLCKQEPTEGGLFLALVS